MRIPGVGNQGIRPDSSRSVMIGPTDKTTLEIVIFLFGDG